MLKRVKENNYKFKHPFASITVDEVEILVSEKGRRSLPKDSIDRLIKLAAMKFIENNYEQSIFDPNFSIPSNVVREIIAFLNVNQEEFSKLVGCQKAKITKVLKGEQKLNKSQSALAIERLSAEAVRRGAMRRMMGKGGDLEKVNQEAIEVINHARHFDEDKRKKAS